MRDLTCWIFTLWKAEEKASLMAKVWVGSISFDLGVLTRMRWLDLPTDSGCGGEGAWPYRGIVSPAAPW